MATTSTATTSGPDWQALAEQATGFLGALAATVTPDPEQDAVAEAYRALRGALGQPTERLVIQRDAASPKVLDVISPPVDAVYYIVRDATPGGKVDQGQFAPTSITLRNINPTRWKAVDRTEAVAVVELYDDDMVLLARGSVAGER